MQFGAPLIAISVVVRITIDSKHTHENSGVLFDSFSRDVVQAATADGGSLGCWGRGCWCRC